MLVGLIVANDIEAIRFVLCLHLSQISFSENSSLLIELVTEQGRIVVGFGLLWHLRETHFEHRRQCDPAVHEGNGMLDVDVIAFHRQGRVL